MTKINRIGILAPSGLLPWQVNALEKVIADGREITQVIIEDKSEDYLNNNSIHSKVEIIRKHINTTNPFILALAYEYVSAQLKGKSMKWLQRKATEEISLFESAKKKLVEPSNDTWTFFDEDIVRDLNENCDIIIRFGFGLIKGDILEATEFGVLSFHPADIEEYRGMGIDPQYISNNTVGKSTLQQLTDDIDACPVVLMDKVTVPEPTTYFEYKKRIFKLQSYMLNKGLRCLEEGYNPRLPPRLGEYTPVTHRQSIKHTARILYKDIQNDVRRIFN